MLEEQIIQEPRAHIPPGLGNSHILWSGPGQSAGLLQTPLFPSVDPGLFITPALPARPLQIQETVTPGLDILRAPSALAFHDFPDIHTPLEAALPSPGVGSGGLPLIAL